MSDEQPAAPQSRTDAECRAMNQLDERFQGFMVQLVLTAKNLHGLALSDVIEIVLRWVVACADPHAPTEGVRSSLIATLDDFLAARERGELNDSPPRPRGQA